LGIGRRRVDETLPAPIGFDLALTGFDACEIDEMLFGDRQEKMRFRNRA
jgi:hypothetical protein